MSNPSATSQDQALETFRRGSAILEEALRGATEEETTFVPGPGKWTIRQLVRHVADTEIVVGMRMRQIIAEDSPTLIPFDQDKWAANLGYEKADAFDSLARFRSLRDDTSRVLDALPAHAFERAGVHPERGSKTLLEWVALFGGHVETHAKQIRGIRAAWTAK
jgi:hypothetical protein